MPLSTPLSTPLPLLRRDVGLGGVTASEGAPGWRAAVCCASAAATSVSAAVSAHGPVAAAAAAAASAATDPPAAGERDGLLIGRWRPGSCGVLPGALSSAKTASSCVLRRTAATCCVLVTRRPSASISSCSSRSIAIWASVGRRRGVRSRALPRRCCRSCVLQNAAQRQHEEGEEGQGRKRTASARWGGRR